MSAEVILNVLLVSEVPLLLVVAEVVEVLVVVMVVVATS